MWLPIVPQGIQPSSKASEDLLKMLFDCRVNALPLLFCAILACEQGKVLLPSTSKCQLILDIFSTFDKAKAACPLLLLFRCLSPTILGRIARSTSCILAPRSCITTALFYALASPTLLLFSGSLGWITGCDDLSSLHEYAGRVVCLSRSMVFQPICELFSTLHPLYLCVKDCIEASRAAPISTSELRAVLFHHKRCRHVRRWFSCLDVLHSVTSSIH